MPPETEVAIDARIATPRAPPTCWEVLMSPEARPAWSGRVPVTAAIVTGTNEKPRPTAASSEGPRTSETNEPPTEICVNHRSPAATISSPKVSVGLKPIRVTSCEAAPADRMIATDSGR
jgi:hypothetical protein